jgi:hypothetical protein
VRYSRQLSCEELKFSIQRREKHLIGENEKAAAFFLVEKWFFRCCKLETEASVEPLSLADTLVQKNSGRRSKMMVLNF